MEQKYKIRLMHLADTFLQSDFAFKAYMYI